MSSFSFLPLKSFVFASVRLKACPYSKTCFSFRKLETIEALDSPSTVFPDQLCETRYHYLGRLDAYGGRVVSSLIADSPFCYNNTVTPLAVT